MTMKNLDEFKDWLGEWATGFSDAKAASAEYTEGPDYSLARFRGVGTNERQMDRSRPPIVGWTSRSGRCCTSTPTAW